jgi:hypothetical protein
VADAAPTLGPQAALEAAAAQLIRETLRLDPSACGRQFDGRPPPSAGDAYYSVWSKGARESPAPVPLDERLGVNVTVTLRLKRPRDRWVEDRDDLERRLNEVRAILHADSTNQRLINLAGELGGRGQAGTRHVNFCQALYLLKFEPLVVAPGEWFQSGKGGEAGLAQTAVFGGARLVQHSLRAV